MKVNPFILGTVQFGLTYGINNRKGKPGKKTVFKILDFAYENGITQLDCSDTYGNSQKIIGEFICNTKKHFEINSKFRISNISIPEQLHQSLRELHTDHVNVYFYHRFSDLVNNSKTLNILKNLKEQDKIKKSGVSIYTNPEFEAAINFEQIDVIQIPFNMLDNYSHRGELLRKAKQLNKEIQVRSVFLQGLFFKSPQELPEFLESLKRDIIQLHTLQTQLQIPMEGLALKYAMAFNEINYIIIGVDSLQQLEINLSMLTEALPPEVVSEINKIQVSNTDLLYPYNWN